jgi:hypothetical protein
MVLVATHFGNFIGALLLPSCPVTIEAFLSEIQIGLPISEITIRVETVAEYAARFDGV